MQYTEHAFSRRGPAGAAAPRTCSTQSTPFSRRGPRELQAEATSPEHSQWSWRWLWREEIHQIPLCRKALDGTPQERDGSRLLPVFTATWNDNLSNPRTAKINLYGGKRRKTAEQRRVLHRPSGSRSQDKERVRVGEGKMPCQGGER